MQPLKCSDLYNEIPIELNAIMTFDSVIEIKIAKLANCEIIMRIFTNVPHPVLGFNVGVIEPSFDDGYLYVKFSTNSSAIQLTEKSISAFEKDDDYPFEFLSYNDASGDNINEQEYSDV